MFVAYGDFSNNQTYTMKFQVFSELEYVVNEPTTFIFNIQASQSKSQTILEEHLTIEPFFESEEIVSALGDPRFLRVQIPEPVTFTISYKAIADTRYQIIEQEHLLQSVPVVKLDADIIPYLFPSRYCQSDKFEKLAWREFGSIQNEFAKVAAINEWIYNHVEYLGGMTNSSTSAHDTLIERHGICRDFAHLGITLCRALSIPARYFTGYAYLLTPPDFHACFEAYIGGEWMFFDPTKLVPVNGLVKIANGRDAADASIASIFGNAFCSKITVGCMSIDLDFKLLYIEDSQKQSGISYQ